MKRKKEEGPELKIAVCDDEKWFRRQLCESIRTYDDTYCLYEFCNGEELLLAEEKFQAIFLDIDMPGQTGLETAAALRKRGCRAEIVFLTGHEECMSDAFKVRAMRYLLKPIETEKLYEALETVKEEWLALEEIVLVGKGKITKIELTQIVFLEACGDGVLVYDAEGVAHESSDTLKVWEERLTGKNFYRIHKSYLVAMAYVRRAEGDMVKLRGSIPELKISRRKSGDFKKAYLDYIDRTAR